MKLARLLGIALLAVFAVSAMLASTASAIPKFKLPITKRNFTTASGTSVLRAPAKKDVVTCTSSTTTGGTILGVDEVSAVINYAGCTLEEGTSGPCTIKSVGASGSNSIITSTLKGSLGLITGGGSGAGILFKPASGNVFVKLAATTTPCKSSETAVEGSVAGEFAPTGKSSKTATIKLAPVSATGKQKITKIETLAGVVEPVLESFGAAESTQEQTAVVTFEENVEVD
jgi:hypothetical protein